MSTVSWEDVSCPICDSGSGSEPYLACSDRLREPKLFNYSLVRCRVCGLIYLSPCLCDTSVSEHYQEEGYDPFLSLKKPQGLLEKGYALARSFMLRWKRRLVRDLADPGSHILDIGCGTGEFLFTLRKEFEVEGLEPEPNAARWARERLGLNAHTGDLNVVSLPANTYKIVTMWHVLEHIPDPINALKTIHKLMTADGKLIIALPNISSFDARVYKECWVALDAPRHLWHFTKSQLERIAQTTHFRMVKSGALPLDTFYNSMWSERICVQIKGKAQYLCTLFRLPAVISTSYIHGITTGNHSSNYYIFEKIE